MGARETDVGEREEAKSERVRMKGMEGGWECGSVYSTQMRWHCGRWL